MYEGIIDHLKQRIRVAKCLADNGGYDCGISIDEAEKILAALESESYGPVCPNIKPTVIIHLWNGCIDAIDRENCSSASIRVMVRDYDIEGMDVESENELPADENGYKYVESEW